jgi:TRAP-type C4-dicarboxylate transport system substrate-binding protein
MRLIFLLALAGSARAEPITLRFAATAPRGSSLAHEMIAFAQDVESQTGGRLRVKWYLGAVAGDEAQMVERSRRDQLDGAAGAALCETLAPSLKVLRVLGLVQNDDELRYLLRKLHPIAAREARERGFALIAIAPFGTDVLFTRTPPSDLESLAKLRIWVWDLDTISASQLAAMGMKPMPMPIYEAARAYEQGRIDGFLALPSVALIWQWSALASWMTEVGGGAIQACLVVNQRSLDRLELRDREPLLSAAARLSLRFGDATALIHKQLLGGLFEKQGLHKNPKAESLRVGFFHSAVIAREKLPETQISHALLLEVGGWLADYRSTPR